MNSEYLRLVLAVAAITFTISVTSIFHGFREWISKINPFFEQLIFCPFCLSFYVSTFLVISDIHVPIIGVIDFMTSVFCVMGGSGIVHYFLLRAYKPIQKAMAYRKLDQQILDED